MSKKGPDRKKINRILKILEKSGRKGIWMRELSRQTKIPFTTVFYYIYNYLRDEILIEDVEFDIAKSDRLKIIKLKKLVD